MLVVLSLLSTKKRDCWRTRSHSFSALQLLQSAVTLWLGCEEALWDGGPRVPAEGNGETPKNARYVKFTRLGWFGVGCPGCSPPVYKPTVRCQALPLTSDICFPSSEHCCPWMVWGGVCIGGGSKPVGVFSWCSGLTWVSPTSFDFGTHYQYWLVLADTGGEVTKYCYPQSG